MFKADAHFSHIEKINLKAIVEAMRITKKGGKLEGNVIDRQ